jgi:FkbM family methyltransferase
MSEVSRERLLAALDAAAKSPEPDIRGFMVRPEDRGRGTGKRLMRLVRYRGAYVRHVGHQLSQRLKHLSPDHPVALQTFWGKEFIVPSRDVDARVMGTLGTGGTNEDALIRYFVRTLTDDDIFYDVGANYGFYTALAQELVTNGEIHAFEPNPSVFASLAQVRSSNGNTFLNEVALSDAPGEIAFFDCSGADTSGKSTTMAEVAAKHRWRYRTVTVPAVTLDEYSQTHRPPTVMKIDVEGAESAVLEGGRQTLASAAPIIALELWSGPELSEFSMHAVRILEETGYTPFFVSPAGDATQATFVELTAFLETPQKETNFVFKKVNATHTTV